MVNRTLMPAQTKRMAPIDSTHDVLYFHLDALSQCRDEVKYLFVAKFHYNVVPKETKIFPKLYNYLN